MTMTPFQQSPHRVTPDPADPRRPASGDDDGDGLLLFLVFIVAALTSTAAVVLIALLGEWWVFGLAFSIHVIMTAIVVLTIAQVMAGRHRSLADRDALPVRSLSPRSTPATSRQAAARTTIAATAGSPAVALRRRRADAPLGSDGGRMARRVLVVTDETLASANEVPQPILEQIERADEVYVVAPALTTWLQSLTGDIDGARVSADERLRTVFNHMDASGLESDGTVGDEDQVTAIADALDGFSADLILLRLHAPGSRNENWREHRLVDWVRTHTTVPTIVFYFDDEGRFVRRQDLIALAADAA
ncbi:MAG TPA: hypothetical protein VJ741_22120 [Solirubrobacteraceae bacterium]|nr:hypothetical protein [Solirubrobacteraceae bacterium]